MNFSTMIEIAFKIIIFKNILCILQLEFHIVKINALFNYYVCMYMSIYI